MSKLPFLVLSDGPTFQSGLARITRDLIRGLLTTPDLRDQLDLVQLSVQPQGRLGWSHWPCYSVDDLESYGASTIADVWADCFGDREGILFTIWDPGRCLGISTIEGPWQRWGYFPIDGYNLGGGLTGPSAEAIGRYHRVLTYGRWGSTIVKAIQRGSVSYLPHGIDDAWTPQISEAQLGEAQRIFGSRAEGKIVIGMVATNQPRKDLAVFCQTIAELHQRKLPVFGWLHTDRMIHEAWAIPQLILDTGIARRITVTTSLSDPQMAACYAACGATMLSSLGEGFGYPIVESLACGTPCVHTTYAGGAELVPKAEWRVPARGWRVDGCHAFVRPVLDPMDFANALERALQDVARDPVVSAEWCRGAVEYLRWRHLWPRWSSWFRQGLEAL